MIYEPSSAALIGLRRTSVGHVLSGEACHKMAKTNSLVGPEGFAAGEQRASGRLRRWRSSTTHHRRRWVCGERGLEVLRSHCAEASLPIVLGDGKPNPSNVRICFSFKFSSTVCISCCVEDALGEPQSSDGRGLSHMGDINHSGEVRHCIESILLFSSLVALRRFTWRVHLG